MDRAYGGTFIFIYLLRIGALAGLRVFAAPVDNRPEPDARFGKGIVGKQAFVREEVVGVRVADLTNDLVECASLLLEFVPLALVVQPAARVGFLLLDLVTE